MQGSGQLSPLRLLILALLFYILYRLLIGGGKILSSKKMQGKNKSAANLPVNDVLVEDPVCHTYIPKGQAVQLSHNQQILYFCSNKCCKMFLSEKGAGK